MSLVDIVKHALPMKLADGKRHVWPTLASMVTRNDGSTLEQDGKLNADKLGDQLPEYYAKQETVTQLSKQMSALQSGVEIVPTVNGNAIVLNDASNLPLRGMIVHGRTTQNGTPTPENPVELMTVGRSGSIHVTIPAGNNLFDIEHPTLSNTIISSNNEFVTDFNYNCYRIPMIADSLCITFTRTNNSVDPFRYAMEKNGVIIRNVIADQVGTRVVTKANADAIWLSPVKAGADGEQTQIMLNVGSTSLPYEPFSGKIITLSASSGLSGIPVTSGGNYTDANGQQWICDEIDLERGVYIQRVLRGVINGDQSYGFSNNDVWHINSLNLIFGGAIRGQGLCNLFEVQNKSYIGTGRPTDSYYNTLYIAPDGSSMSINISLFPSADAEGFKTYFAANPMTIYAEAQTAVEIPVSESELAAYRALVTNNPNTTIYNDAGADMTVQYVTNSAKNVATADVAERALDADKLGGKAPEYYKTSLSVLWSNANLSNAFAAQSVVLSAPVENYTFLIIECARSATNASKIAGIFVVGYTSKQYVVFDEFYYRYATNINNTSVTFGEALGEGTGDNNRIVPSRIYGVKLGGA